jgi:hypothetical protein
MCAGPVSPRKRTRSLQITKFVGHLVTSSLATVARFGKFLIGLISLAKMLRQRSNTPPAVGRSHLSASVSFSRRILS